MTAEGAKVDWRDGHVPVSRRFDDPYFSLQDGFAETTHVFLDGNGLPGRYRPGFALAELGTGMGLNLAAALWLWRRSGPGGRLRYVGFELEPPAAGDIDRALRAFAQVAPLAGLIAAIYRAAPEPFETEELSARVIPGDAAVTLPGWAGQADAWFLDGFAPARNPALWTPGILAEVAAHTAPGGTCATYSAAGAVRRGLAAAGFAVDRRPGFGRKRHMTVARKAA